MIEGNQHLSNTSTRLYTLPLLGSTRLRTTRTCTTYTSPHSRSDPCPKSPYLHSHQSNTKRSHHLEASLCFSDAKSIQASKPRHCMWHKWSGPRDAEGRCVTEGQPDWRDLDIRYNTMQKFVSSVQTRCTTTREGAKTHEESLLHARLGLRGGECFASRLGDCVRNQVGLETEAEIRCCWWQFCVRL